jgi:cellulose synthase/poly-beta-1,6-N-acetylglucosamine synthase-like glycosyltransferase
VQPQVLVLLVIAALSALLTIYPYLIYPMILRRIVRPAEKPPELAPTDGSDIALLFCAYNEDSAIPAKIVNLRELLREFPRLEVLVYDDRSSDSTVEQLESSNLALRIIRGSGRTGKAHGMKRLVGTTRRPFLVFTDANVIVSSVAIRAIRSQYRDDRIGGVCGVLEYTSQGSTTATVGGLYWKLEEAVKSHESRTGSVMGADGSIFSVRRELYPDFPDTVQDDFTVSMSVLFAGRRLVRDARALATEDLVEVRGEEFRRKVRIAARAYHTHRFMAPRIRQLSGMLQWMYWSHKQLRWFGGLFVVTAAAATLAAMWSISLGLGAVASIGAALVVVIGARARTGPIAALADAGGSILATTWGVLKASRGFTMATWQPPRRQASR